LRAADLQRKPWQQVLNQIGLMRAQPVALAPAKERALGMDGDGFPGRRIAISGIPDCRTHRSNWYCRCSSRVRGSMVAGKSR
jgi:hypothetical protein